MTRFMAGKAIRWGTDGPGMPRRSEPGQCAACTAESVAWRTERISVAAGGGGLQPPCRESGPNDLGCLLISEIATLEPNIGLGVVAGARSP